MAIEYYDVVERKRREKKCLHLLVFLGLLSYSSSINWYNAIVNKQFALYMEKGSDTISENHQSRKPSTYEKVLN